MASTNSPAALSDSCGIWGWSLSHCPRWLCQSNSTWANCCVTDVCQGTNKGRAGSPVFNNARLLSNSSTRLCTSWGGRSACTALTRRQVCMRMRPASLTAAAPPSSCQVTHKVRPIDARATTNKLDPMRMNLLESEDLFRIQATWSDRLRVLYSIACKFSARSPLSPSTRLEPRLQRAGRAFMRV